MSPLTRTEAVREILPDLGDAIVVSALGYASWCLVTVVDRPQNLYLRGAMGSVIPVAFGIAQARSDRRVIALEGDGSALMNLGALATVGAYAPRNLVAIIWDDHRYETTGGQPTHTARGVDLCAIAKGAGIASARTASERASFATAVRDALHAPGPHVIVTSIVPETTPPSRRTGRAELNVHKVMQDLGTCECHRR